jgi:outer membrane protein OmpA-like peptidoglycan-associated protein
MPKLTRMMRGSVILSWVITMLVPALGCPGVAETLPHSPPQDLRLQSLDLTFHTLDLRFRVEDVKGAAQALAMKETATAVTIELSGDILFDFDKADIRVAAEPALQRVVEIIRQYPKAAISIDGYTDAKGADAYNLQLSEKRATSVKSWLVQNGAIESKRIKTKGWGKAKPVAPNANPDGSDNPEGRQKNRRVEITVKK